MTVHGCLRKVGCVFSERNVWGMEIYFVNGKRVSLLQSWLFLNGKNKELSGYRKLQKVCGRGTLRKEFCMWSGLSKVGLNLIR